MLSSQGKLIVFEGGDGSGKTVQSSMLRDFFSENKLSHAYIDFPDYESHYGQMIGAFLRGEYGSIDQVSPYLAGLLFALDRAEKKTEIDTLLQENKYIVANRYVTSNMAHQGSKITDETARTAYLDWLAKLEYQHNKLPKEDIVVYLYVPWQVAAELTKQKQDRSYLNGNKTDIQEQDVNHRQASEEMYKHLAKINDNWITIDCTEHGTILSKSTIHEQVLTALRQHEIIS
ncbi:MAG: dTMP kinase [Weeksellaceae bacterium]